MQRAGSPGGIEILSFLPPCAKEKIILSNRESGFLALRRSRGDAPRSPVGEAEELRLFWDFQAAPKESRYQKRGSGKGPDGKGPYQRPRHYRSKSFRKISAPKAAVDSEKRIRCP